MKRFILMIGLMAAMNIPVAMASTLTSGTDTTEFSSGTAALASEMNANFQALIAAINDNSQRISALEGTVGTGSVAGTYSFTEIAVELGADSATASIADGYSEINSYRTTGSLTFDAAGTLSGSTTEVRSSLEDAVDGDCASACRNAFDPNFNTSTPSSLSGTWTETASTVVVTLANGDTVTLLKAGPKLLVTSSKDVTPGQTTSLFDYTGLVLLIKQ